MSTELERTTERYNEAKDYTALLQSPGYIRFTEELEKRIETITNKALGIGWTTIEEEHRALIEARLMKSLLKDIEAKANHAPKLEGRLEALGVHVSHIE